MKRLRIYYADDDKDDIQFLKIAAESIGHHVTTFKNGTDLYEKAISEEVKPDFIFLDQFMPDITGSQIVQKIKKSDVLKHIPAIMVSGSCAECDVASYLDSGANFVFEKPSSVAHYTTLLQNIATINWESYDMRSANTTK